MTTDANGNIWPNIPVTATPAIPYAGPVNHAPIVALIGHSYARNHVAKTPVVSVSRNGGTVTLAASSSLAAVIGYRYKITGCGSPYDADQVTLTAVDNTNFIYQWTISDTSTAAAFVPGWAYAYDLGSSGAFGGINSYGWLGLAQVALKNAFDLPATYVLPSSGGGFCSLFAGDPGFLLQCLRLSTLNPLPRDVVVDLGINDFNSPKTISQVMDAVYQGVAVLNTWTKNVIFVMPRPSNKSAAINRQVCQFIEEMTRQAAAGKWFVMNSRRRLRDITSASGAMLAGMTLDGIHLNSSGAQQDAFEFAQTFGWLYPAANASSLPATQTDFYDATSNQLGDLTAVGLPVATAGSLSLTGSFQTFGPFQVRITGAGSSTATAQIAARTDTFPDGTVVPGYELVVTFSAGTGLKTATVMLGPSGVYSLAGPANSGTAYVSGDSLFGLVDFAIDQSSLGASVTNHLPTLYLLEREYTLMTDNASYMFNDDDAVTGLKLVNGVIATRLLKTRPNSGFAFLGFQWAVDGTFATTPTLRIRMMAIKKNASNNPRLY